MKRQQLEGGELPQLFMVLPERSGGSLRPSAWCVPGPEAGRGAERGQHRSAKLMVSVQVLPFLCHLGQSRLPSPSLSVLFCKMGVTLNPDLRLAESHGDPGREAARSMCTKFLLQSLSVTSKEGETSEVGAGEHTPASDTDKGCHHCPQPVS